MPLITRISEEVSRCGDERGQDDWSSSAQRLCRCRQAWNRLGDRRRSRRSARNGMHTRA